MTAANAVIRSFINKDNKVKLIFLKIFEVTIMRDD